MKRYLILLTVFAIGIESYAQFWQNFREDNYTADVDSIAQNHHLIAIAPPVVSIETLEEIDIRSLIFQQETASKDFQKEMYSWMLKRKKQGKMTAEIQNADTSNAKLRRAGYYAGTPLSPIEICQILGVDGVITTNYTLSKPLPAGAAVASGLIRVAASESLGPATYFPVHSSWPKVTFSIGIHDFKTNKTIWGYDNTISVGVFSTTEHIVNVLLSDKNRKMPYIIK
jgi:hypothetical protein